MKEAVLYKKGNNKIVQCLACNWYCQIPPNQTGICATRQNINGKLFSLVYGLAYGICVDPIEKKPLFHFLPGKKILSFGTVGCNFGCRFCQNWFESQYSKVIKKRFNRDDLKKLGENLAKNAIKISPKEILDYAVSHKIPAIAYTYNEPAIFIEYACDTAKLAKKKGIKNVFVSNGYESKETMKYIGPYLDAINIDLKSYQEEFYQKICQAKLQPVLETIKLVRKMKIWQEITTLVIPGKNDSEKELTDIARFIASVSCDIPWHVTAFHPDYRMNDIAETKDEALIRAYNIGKDTGLRYVYVGNIYNNKHESTYCSKCNEKLISRNGYDVDIINLVNGICGKCGEKIAGIWW